MDLLISLRERPKSVGELSGELSEERSKVSHGLRILRECRLVLARREGRQVFYSINEDTVKPLLEIVDRHAGKYCVRCEVAR